MTWDRHYPPEPPLYGWTKAGKPVRKLDSEPIDETLDQWLARFERKLDAQRRRRAAVQAAAAPPKDPPLTEAEAKEALAAATAYLQRAVAHPAGSSTSNPPKTPPPSKSAADLHREWEARIAGWRGRTGRKQKKLF